MSIQLQKMEFLHQKINVTLEKIFNMTVSNESSAIPVPKMLTEYFAVLDNEFLELYTISSKGLFKKEFFLGSNTHKIMYKDFQKAEFGKGNGILWLQSVVSGKNLIFTSNWKLEGSKALVEIINKTIEITDYNLFK